MSDTPDAAAPSSAPSAEARAQRSRAFLINIMLTFFISLAVFVVGTYFFVIPYLYDHETRLNDMRAWAQSHKEWHEQAAAEAEAAAETAAAAPTAAPPAPAAPGDAAAPTAPTAPAAPAAAAPTP